MDPKISMVASDHVERHESLPERRRSIDRPVHGQQPVWEQGRSYGPAGIRGIFTSRYVFAAAAFATLGGTLFGYDQGVVSITLVMPQFLEEFPEIDSQNSGASFKKGLLTAMIELGAFLGAMNQGWIADKISRKWSILLAACIFLVGSALQTGSVNYGMLTGARFVGGIGVGMFAMVAPLYISEISPPEIRGTLLVLQELSIVTGIVIAFYITYGTRHIPNHWSWRLPFLIQMLPAIGLGIGVPFLPYTPRWLCQNGRDEQALKTLAKLRQVSEEDPRVQQEWYEIRSEVAYRAEIEREKYPTLQDGSVKSRLLIQANNWADCWRGTAWRRTQVGVGLMFFQQFVGINALIYYSPTLFATMGLDYEMQLTMSGVLNVCQVVACLWSLWGMDRFGRRKLLLGGGVCMFVSHFIIAVLVGLYNGKWPEHEAAAWTSVSFLLFFMLTFGATWGPIPWAMPAEVFPSTIRAKGCAQATMSNWGNNFIIGLITPPMLTSIGFGTYVFFAAFCLLALIWVYFFIPETMGRTLEQMDYVFNDNQTSVEQERRARIEAQMTERIQSESPKAPTLIDGLNFFQRITKARDNGSHGRRSGHDLARSLFSLVGQTALVVDGAGDVGHTAAVALAKAGTDILLFEGDISTRGEIERLGRKVFMYTADLCSQESVTALVFDILAKGHIVHVLLNCSDTQRQHPAHLFPDDDWEEVLKTSLTTAFTVCREVGTHMLERNPDASGHRGSIINIVSRVADKNGLSTLANSASNGGVSQLTKALSNEWAAEGIRVNAIALDRTTLEIHPSLTGDMDTREDDLRRERQAAYGTPEGLEGSVVYLASRASGYVTGTTMTVKGK